MVCICQQLLRSLSHVSASLEHELRGTGLCQEDHVGLQQCKSGAVHSKSVTHIDMYAQALVCSGQNFFV